MSLLATNEGEVILLSLIVNKKPQADLTLRLYTSPTDTIPETAGWNTPIVEPAGASGYAAVTLTGVNWSISTDGNSITTATYPSVTFTFTSAPSPVYGYLVTYNDGGTNRIAWIERFTGAPFTIPIDGGTIAVTPRITLE
jgi:hypothetical protein